MKTKPALLISLLAIAALDPLVAADPPPPEVIVAVATEKKFSDRIEALGTLRAKESVDLTAKVTETVIEVGFSDGQRVARGDVLVHLSATEEEAMLTEARSTATEAQSQFERSQQLAGQGAASTAQLDEARRVYETARARALAIESRIHDLVITAPFDGIVGLRNISVGALVQPGDLITTIDDDSTMKLDFAVPSSFLPDVTPATPVLAKARAYGNKLFEGEIRSVSSRVDPVTRSVLVRAELPNPDRLLKPGLLMTVELQSNTRTAVLIPEEALMPVGRKNFVMVVGEASEGGTIARRREVKPGGRREGEVEILEGLSPGEQVISRGTLKVRDGALVRIASIDSGGSPLPDLLNPNQRD